jgi:hypothetical protein
MLKQIRAHCFATAVLAGALLASACGGSTARYISNGQENVFFKVPSKWKVFRFTATDKEGRAQAVPSTFERSWHLMIDGSTKPDPAHVRAHAADAPVVEAQVYVLSSSSNDTLSLSDLRSITFGGFDPILQDPGAGRRWEGIAGSFKDLSFPKGLTGTRVAVNIPDPEAKDDPKKFATLDAIAMHDVVNKRVYMFTVRCSAQCYLDNRTQIDDILSSWTVNRK